MSSSMGGSTGMKSGGGVTGDKRPSGYKVAQLQQFTPEQLELFGQMFPHVSPESHTSKLALGDQSYFDEIEAPALRQFNELQGGIASRFSGGGGGQGAMSSRRSSGFQNTSTAAASNFAQQLQSQRQGLQRQAIQDLMEMSSTLLDKRPYEREFYQKDQNKKSGWGGAIGAGVGAVGGFVAGGGNPMTAMQGAQLGYGVGSQF